METRDFARLRKIEGLAGGAKPRVVDIFSGCGGISLGFHTAGFQIIANLEVDELAAATHAHNFHKTEPEERQRLHARPRDITKLEPDEFLRELYPDEDPILLTDVLVGGPPCQAFARVGRAKLREVAAHPEAYKQDLRAKLYTRYLHYVRELKPVALVMENVPDVLNFGGHNIPEEMCEVLEDLGYECRYTLLNAVYYGVPEMRERLILIAIAKEVGSIPQFPVPTHNATLPAGYVSARRVAMQRLVGPSATTHNHFVTPPEVPADAATFVSAEEAIGDLPPITLHLKGQLKRGTRRFNKLSPYPGPAHSSYAQLMRTWPGFESFEGVYDHVIRSLPRDYPIFERMRAGEQYPEAHRHALALLQERIGDLRAGGEDILEGSPRYEQLRAQVVPPYDPTKFPNKWRKMEPDQPARTLMAHLGKDSYSHIHYDDSQARTISVREAARLQSFPDGFKFVGTMNPAFRQVGNAVPPLMARKIAATLKSLLLERGPAAGTAAAQ